MTTSRSSRRTATPPLLVSVCCLALLLPGCGDRVEPMTEEERIGETLVGSWRLDPVKTRSASLATSPGAREARDAVEEYLANEAAPGLVDAFRSMQSSGESPLRLAGLIKALQDGASLNEALERVPAPPDPYKDLSLTLRFADGRMAVAGSDRGWSYSLTGIDEETGQTTLALGSAADSWTLRLMVGEETLTIRPDQDFSSKTGLEAALPPSTVLVFVRAD